MSSVVLLTWVAARSSSLVVALVKRLLVVLLGRLAVRGLLLLVAVRWRSVVPLLRLVVRCLLLLLVSSSSPRVLTVGRLLAVPRRRSVVVHPTPPSTVARAGTEAGRTWHLAREQVLAHLRNVKRSSKQKKVSFLLLNVRGRESVKRGKD